MFRPKCCTTPIPAEFLGYELGDEWTPHYKVYNYFHHVAAQSELVIIEDYGKSYEVVNLHM